MPMPDFPTLQKFYRDRFRPVTVEEFFLVDELARNQTVLQKLYDKEMEQLNAEMIDSWSFMGHFQRRVAAARRAWDKSLHDLQALQKQRLAGVQQRASEPKKQAPAKPPATKPPTLELAFDRSAGEPRGSSSKLTPAPRARLPASARS